MAKFSLLAPVLMIGVAWHNPSRRSPPTYVWMKHSAILWDYCYHNSWSLF
jgi:hypothetical protein